MRTKLPKDWVRCKLGEICSKAQYGWTSKAVDHGTIKYIRTTDISSDEINWQKVPYCLTIPDNVEKYQLNKNDILISRSGSVGLSCRIETEVDFPVVFASYLIRFKTYNEITASYLQQFFNSQEYWEQVESLSSGIAIPNINATKLQQIKVPLPPLKEQEAIVSKLTLLQEKAKRIIERINENLKQLQQWRKSVLNSAFKGELTNNWRIEHKYISTSNSLTTRNTSKFKPDKSLRILDSIPKSWKWVALGNYAECNRGRFSIRPRNDPRYFSGKYPFIQIGDLPKDGGLILKHTQTLNDDGIKVSKLFKKNTVVVAIVGSTIGNTGLLGYDMYFTDSMVGINTGASYSNIFIEYYLRSEKENVRASSYSGGGQPNIKLQILNNYPVPLPPLEEQKIIVKKINEAFASIDKLELHYNNLKSNVNQTLQNMRVRAFSGKLVPQIPNTPSAGELLKDIESMKKKEAKDPKKTRVTLPRIIEEKSLQSLILDNLKDKTFSFEELQKSLSLDYHELSEQFLQLVAYDNKSGPLVMSFDQKRNIMLFKLKKL